MAKHRRADRHRDREHDQQTAPASRRGVDDGLQTEAEARRPPRQQQASRVRRRQHADRRDRQACADGDARAPSEPPGFQAPCRQPQCRDHQTKQVHISHQDRRELAQGRPWREPRRQCRAQDFLQAPTPGHRGQARHVLPCDPRHERARGERKQDTGERDRASSAPRARPSAHGGRHRPDGRRRCQRHAHQQAGHPDVTHRRPRNRQDADAHYQQRRGVVARRDAAPCRAGRQERARCGQRHRRGDAQSHDGGETGQADQHEHQGSRRRDVRAEAKPEICAIEQRHERQTRLRVEEPGSVGVRPGGRLSSRQPPRQEARPRHEHGERPTSETDQRKRRGGSHGQRAVWYPRATVRAIARYRLEPVPPLTSFRNPDLTHASRRGNGRCVP